MAQTIHPGVLGAVILTVLFGLPGVGSTQNPKPAPSEPQYKGKPSSHWIKRLADKDPIVRREAMLAVTALGADAVAALPAVLRGLDDDDTIVREHSLEALAAIGPPAKDAVPVLTRALADKDTVYRDKAIRALDAIGVVDDTIVIAVANIMVDSNRKGRGSTTEVYKFLTRRGPAAKAAIPILKEGLKGPGQQVQAIFTLGYLGADATPVLMELWKSKESNTRSAVLESFRTLGSHAKSAIPDLKKAAVTDKDPDATLAIYLLGAIGVDALPALMDLMKEADLNHAREATNKIGLMGPRAKDAIPSLTEALKKRGVAEAASNALAEIGPAAVPSLVESLKDRSSRPHALRALNRLGPKAKDAIPALTELLKDDTWWQLASSTLHNIGTDAIPALIKAAEDFENERAASLLWDMGRKNPAAAKLMVPDLIKMLKNPEAQLRQRAASTLGQIGISASQAETALAEAEKDPSPGVRRAATEALKNITPR